MSDNSVKKNLLYQDLVRAVWDGLNAGDVSVLNNILAPNYTLNGQPYSADGTEKWLTSIMEQADVKFERQDLFGEGDKVCIRWNLYLTSRHDGSVVEGMGINVLSFNDQDQCVSNWQSGASALNDFHPVAPPAAGSK